MKIVKISLLALALAGTSTEGLKAKTGGGLRRLRDEGAERRRLKKGRPAPPPQKTTVGFTVSCRDDEKPGLDGDHKAYVSYSFHFPGMSYVYESVTELDARSVPADGSPPRSQGEDTEEVAQKIARDLDAATKPPEKRPLTPEQRAKIKVQTDKGGPGNTRARIVATGADHVDFGTKGENGKIRWVALTEPPRTSPPAAKMMPITFGGSGTESWPPRLWEKKKDAETVVGKWQKNTGRYPGLRPGILVPSPDGEPQQRNQRFKSTKTQNGKPPSKGDEHGLYIHEGRGWFDAK